MTTLFIASNVIPGLQAVAQSEIPIYCDMSLRAKRSNLLGCGEIAASPATPRDDIMTQFADPESSQGKE